MARLPEVDLQQNPDIAASFERVQASRGWVSNLMKSLAHAPDGLQRFQQLGHYARYDTQLTEMQKELTICIVGRNIDYAWTHHGALAREVGVTAVQLTELKANRTPQDLGPTERALCDYVFAFSTFGGIPDAAMAAVLQHFSPRQVTDIALIAAFYTAAGSLIMANDVRIEGPEALQTEIDWQRKKMAETAP